MHQTRLQAGLLSPGIQVELLEKMSWSRKDREGCQSGRKRKAKGPFIMDHNEEHHLCALVIVY